MNNSCALIGIGNIMFCDDGLGIYAAAFIKENYDIPSNLEILDGGGLGFTLMTYLSSYERVFIISTTSQGDESGEVFVFDKEQLINQGATRQSANEVEVVQMVEICSILDEEMAQIEIIAMKPHDIVPVEANLTDVVQKNFLKLIEKTIQTLATKDIILKPKKEQIPLSQILQTYANPTQQIHI